MPSIAGADRPGVVPAFRVRSIDIVRGAVMVLMAIDHVRVYAGLPPGGPTAGIFFTRWVTHFCAPAFAFLAGTAAFLHGMKLGDRAALSRFLWTRGLILVALELTLIHASWTFTLDFTRELAGVIWMLGWCMVLMAGLVRLSPRAVGTIGVLIILFQQVFGLIGGALPGSLRWIGQLLYFGGGIRVGSGFTLTVLYNLVPWIGVMAAGYGFGLIMTREPAARRRACLRIGVGAIVAFLVIGSTVALLTATPDGGPFLFRLLEQNKYRNSQLFLLMTLGPTIALLPLAEGGPGVVVRALETFGRVPMFYYLLHIPLIHATALVAWFLRDGTMGGERFASAPFVSIPEPQQWSLGLLYLVFAIDVAVLYVACRWFAGIKARAPRTGWIQYL